MKPLKTVIALASLLCSVISCRCDRTGFAVVEDGHIVMDHVPQYYIGTNVWYASRLAIEDPDRLRSELDTLHSLGIDNIRTCATDENFEGLDMVFDELRSRGMKAVLFLNNAWEWTDDAYYSYLERAGAGRQPRPSVEGYSAFMDAMSGFAANEKAVRLYREHVSRVVSRYKDEPAVFSWQICNEPRPFSTDPVKVAAFADYVTGTAALIKSIDSKHLVSTGNEGSMGCNGWDYELFRRIHSSPDVDYCTIHIWPYNWGWVKEDAIGEGIGNAITKMNEYINEHAHIALELGKPLVIEEFGYPRDGFEYANTSTAEGRDAVYEAVFGRVCESAAEGGPIAGCNFWTWSGYAAQTPGHQFWQEGDDLCGDPFQEAQGLNGVYLSDKSTVGVIKKYTDRLASTLTVCGRNKQAWLQSGDKPFVLDAAVSGMKADSFELNLDLVRDLGLTEDRQDTVLHITRDIRSDCAFAENISFDLGKLEPGFYKAAFSTVREGKRHQETCFNIGTDPESIVSEQSKQPDFDEFWEKTLSELAEVPMDAELKLLPEHSNDVRRLYEVRLKSLGGATAGGLLAVPVAEGKYPVIVEYMGYGAQPYYYDPSAEPGKIQFLFTSRGQGICMDEPRDWDCRGLESKESYYYRGAYCDIVRSLDFICSLEKADTSRIIAVGESQGGAFTWISASLDHRVRAIAPAVPFLSDFEDYGRIVWWPMGEIKAAAGGISDYMTTLSYFDIKNFTDRVRCPVLMAFGLQDPTCPPHTNFAGYNQVRAEKSYFCVPTCGHAMWCERSWAEKRKEFIESQL